MTSTIKDLPELNSPGKPGALSQNSENKPGQSPRSNPVCLEVCITIRSLPTEPSGQSQPIREEGRTVIVFDNGAVLRSTSIMPIGQTVILSNPSGRDVVCRVVGGRNLPNIKGYVEIEFIEPVDDFWGIHQDVGPVAAAPSLAAPFTPREAPVPPPFAPAATSRAGAISEASAKPGSLPFGTGPSFEDIPGLVSIPPVPASRGAKSEPGRHGLELVTNETSGYSHSETARSTSLASWPSSPSEPHNEKRSIPAASEELSITSPASATSRDFMSKGLMAYEQPESSTRPSNGRLPLIVGVATLALAGICAVVFFVHRRNAPVSDTKAAEVTQPTTSVPSPASNAPDAVQSPQVEPSQAAAQAQIQAQPVAVEEAHPVAAVSPIPAVVTGPAGTDSRTETRTETRNVPRQEKNAVAIKQADPSPSRRLAMTNLKIGSPSAPNQNLVNLSEGTAPIADISSTEAAGATPPAGLLTSAGRTSNPPVAPPSAPAPEPVARTFREPKLISSTQLVYPSAARQSNIQGSVTVSATIDANGNVIGAKALSGPLLLRQAAEGSVRQWKYSPALVDGKPATSQVSVSVEFRLR